MELPSKTSSIVLPKKGLSGDTSTAPTLNTESSAPRLAVCSAKLMPSSIPCLSNPIVSVLPSSYSISISARNAVPSGRITSMYCGVKTKGTGSPVSLSKDTCVKSITLVLLARSLTCRCKSTIACCSASLLASSDLDIR